MEITNKDFFKNIEKQGYAGNIIDWYKYCVKPSDLFRIWFKDNPDGTCDFYHIVNVITAGDDIFLGMVPYDCNDNPVYWHRLSEISSFALLPNEEDI